MILNLHGLNGSSHNTTYSLLVDMYSQEYVISPQIDYVMKSPAEILERLSQYESINLVVGNSFGGFYAYILSNMCHIPCLLVNPCIPPDKYIPFLVEGYAYTNELVNLMKKYHNNSQMIYMILGIDDNVLCPDYTERIVDFTKLWKINGGHSLSGNQKFYDIFRKGVEEIKKIITAEN